MATISSTCKNIHGSPSSREFNYDSVGVVVSQTGSLIHDQGNMLSADINLMEMTEVEYTHLQHIIQTHMEAADSDESDAQFHPNVFSIHPETIKDDGGSISPTSMTQAIDLSTSNDEQSVIPEIGPQETVDIEDIKMVFDCNPEGGIGEKTPTTCGEVPGSVLARIKSELFVTEEDSSVNTSTCYSFQTRPHPSARVCLERRFNCKPSEIGTQQTPQSAVLSNLLTILQQSTDAHEANKQMQNWMRSDHNIPIELAKPYGGGMFNQISGICGQAFGHIPHIVEPTKHQALVFPKNLAFTYRPERVPTKGQCISRAKSVEQHWEIANGQRTPIKYVWAQGSKNLKASNADPDSKGKKTTGKATHSTRKQARPSSDINQRRERHNSKERDRRRRIRLCCDELNTLVPFCNQETDKATTLQWTTAFLKYIEELHGDSFKEQFQNTFCIETGLRVNSSMSPGQVPAFQKTADT